MNVRSVDGKLLGHLDLRGWVPSNDTFVIPALGKDYPWAQPQQHDNSEPERPKTVTMRITRFVHSETGAIDWAAVPAYGQENLSEVDRYLFRRGEFDD